MGRVLDFQGGLGRALYGSPGVRVEVDSQRNLREQTCPSTSAGSAIALGR